MQKNTQNINKIKKSGRIAKKIGIWTKSGKNSKEVRKKIRNPGQQRKSGESAEKVRKKCGNVGQQRKPSESAEKVRKKCGNLVRHGNLR